MAEPSSTVWTDDEDVIRRMLSENPAEPSAPLDTPKTPGEQINPGERAKHDSVVKPTSFKIIPESFARLWTDAEDDFLRKAHNAQISLTDMQRAFLPYHVSADAITKRLNLLGLWEGDAGLEMSKIENIQGVPIPSSAQPGSQRAPSLPLSQARILAGAEVDHTKIIPQPPPEASSSAGGPQPPHDSRLDSDIKNGTTFLDGDTDDADGETDDEEIIGEAPAHFDDDEIMEEAPAHLDDDEIMREALAHLDDDGNMREALAHLNDDEGLREALADADVGGGSGQNASLETLKTPEAQAFQGEPKHNESAFKPTPPAPSVPPQGLDPSTPNPSSASRAKIPNWNGHEIAKIFMGLDRDFSGGDIWREYFQIDSYGPGLRTLASVRSKVTRIKRLPTEKEKSLRLLLFQRGLLAEHHLRLG
ncbi:hypothetical protein BU16DRAFT_565837 [Lophium mytilinum]|uniref:Uncharacterized protein n=1 Tax=Lophium mytilinum TaxID=390894 RepID=A0A6A6QET3_9PEZI|nr:hypothetical protein BU16DRAFT_565837 [Lophium mytilinum]